jgi:formylmethanofuran dehydrogenase subunit E
MHDMSDSKYVNLEKDYSLEDLAAFHGHLGPYLILGYRIGRYARDYICSDPFHMSVEVLCSGKPPQSCIVDGIQLGSGCTYGKRNIDIITNASIKCTFIVNGKHISIIPKPIKDVGEDEDEIELLAEKMFGIDDNELFEVKAEKS